MSVSYTHLDVYKRQELLFNDVQKVSPTQLRYNDAREKLITTDNSLNEGAIGYILYADHYMLNSQLQATSITTHL